MLRSRWCMALLCLLGLALSGCGGGGGGSTPAPVVQAPSALVYLTPTATYTKGVPISTNSPSSGGGAVTAYSVSPALPAGLAMNAATGGISGTPTAIAPAATYSVTASNAGGSTSAALNITINDAAPSGLAYPANPAIYTKDMPIAASAPTHGGGAVIGYTVSPALPAGLSLDSNSGVISGTPTVLSPTTIYTVVATNSGGAASTTLSLTVNDAPPVALVYSTSTAIYTKSTAIAANTPTHGGGAVLGYAVTPALPAGLNLDPSSGVISGTPTVVSPATTYTVVATNSGGAASATLNLTVKDVAPSGLVYSTNPASYLKGTPIPSNTPSNSGGTPVSYSITPSLPAGLALNAATGVITGQPSGTSPLTSYTVTATNTSGTTTVSLSITVNDAAPSSLTYASNPAVYLKAVPITANSPSNLGGTATAYAVNPALPAGLSQNTSTGLITGTPTAMTATATYTVTASNTLGSTQANLSLTVNDTPPSNLLYGAMTATYTKGTPIAANTPSSAGGTVVSYSVSPTLPAGLNLNTTTGVLSGTPSTPVAQATYIVTATNSGGSTTANLAITVKDVAPTNLLYTTSTAQYTKGTAIVPNFPSNLGGTVVSYAVSPALPAGLSLSTVTGMISGTPTTITATATYTVTATNTGGTASVGLAITINDIAPTNLTYSANPATYVKGSAITANQPSHLGGNPTGYSVSPALPAGLSLSSTTGIISGTPTSGLVSTSFLVSASNPSGSTSVSLNLTVIDPATLPPNITGLNPSQGPVGTPVVITGINLGFAGTTLALQGTTLVPTSQSATQITFVVPSGALSGNLVLTAPGGVVSKPFTVSTGSTTLDLHVEAIQLTQSSQTLTNTVPIVAGKPGLIRVFVLANQANTAQPAVQVTLMNNGVTVPGYPKTLGAPGTSVPTVVDDSSLTKSWNLAVPGTDLTTPTGTGYSVQAVVDPAGLIAEADETNNTLTQTLAGTTVPTFKSTIFPVVLSSGTGNISAANKDAWIARLAKMYPIASTDVVVGVSFTGSVATLLSDGTGWSTLLNDLTAKHLADAVSDRYYYGALNVSYGSGVAGLGWVPGTSATAYKYRTAIGWDKTVGYADGGQFPEVFAHETGHNMGRPHSPCGGVASADANYPYPGGIIGVPGYDSVLNLLEDPTTTFDIMGYCTPNWVSDYVYTKILNFRAGSGGFLVVGAEDTPPAQNEPRECLLVRGIVHGDGRVEFLPAFRTRALPSVPVATAEYTLEGLDANGQTAFTSPLELMELGCGLDSSERHFVMALPLETAVLDSVMGLRVRKAGLPVAEQTSTHAQARLVSFEPELLRVSQEEVLVSWDASVHPTVMVRDADTGEVVAILKEGRQIIPSGAHRFDLVFSDGVRGHTQRVELAN